MTTLEDVFSDLPAGLRNPLLKQYREANHCPEGDQLCEEVAGFSHHLLLGNEEDIDDIADALVKIYEGRDELSKL